MKLPKYFCALLVSILLLSAATVAQWPCSPTECVSISGESNNQWNSQLIEDHSGRIISFWQDRRSGVFENIYLQRLTTTGLKEWQTSGVKVSNASGNQASPSVISDSLGIIVVWHDNRTTNDNNIYAQKFNYSGQPLWTADGITICSATGNQSNPKIVSDNLGGAIIVWQDRRNGTDNNIYAQRINANGLAQWAANGIVVTSASFDQFNPQLVTDGTNGAIVAWHDYRVGTGYIDIYAQRVLSNGSMSWQANGVAVTTANHNQTNLQMIADGFKGAIIVWQDRRTSTADDIYGQRLSPSGTILWTLNGSPIAVSSGFKSFPQLASNYAGGAVVTWQDNRTGTDYNIYAQNLSLYGEELWTKNGIPICSATGHQYYPQIVTDKSGNSIITWQDRRSSSDYDIYAQRVDAYGIINWATNGLIINLAPYDQIEPRILLDNDGGAIISWTDYKGTGYSDISAHRIGTNGKYAGGCFRSFTQDDFIQKAVRLKTSIGVPKPMPTGGNVRDTLFKRGIFPTGIVLGVAKPDSATLFGWIRIQRQWNVKRFLVQAGTARPFDMRGTKYFIRELRNPTPRSYDNHLAGELLTLKLNIAASDNKITPTGLGEIIYYDSLKGNGFNGKTIRKLASFADSALTNWRYYKLMDYTLLDSVLTRINKAFAAPIDTISTSPLVIKSSRGIYASPFLRIAKTSSPLQMLAAQYDESETPEQFHLYQNYPNPFNPTTNIEFDLVDASAVSLIIYNTLGQEVGRLLNNEEIEAGKNVITFEAEGLSSGVYFYKLIVNQTQHQIKKMVLLR
ncbi:MAG: T9SS type A sorting domain-containing protein [Bacteroidota bacterium]|nr:T9SS type A sorting domain-containing protein [Bacteroidota bacterium]